MIPTIIIVSLILIYIGFVIGKLIKDKKAGVSCPSCTGCVHSDACKSKHS